MHRRIIEFTRPHLIRGGRPTTIVRTLAKTEKGRAVIIAMFNYYLAYGTYSEYSSWKLDTSIDIEKYRLPSYITYLNRIRRAGL